MRLKLDTSNALLSKNDIKRGLKLPKELTITLAEDIGIMVGDGNIMSDGNYRVKVTGNMITDSHFFAQRVRPMKRALFGLSFRLENAPSKKTSNLLTYSKGLVWFYHKVILLPRGPKKEIRVPKIIMESDDPIKKGFLRGLGDTDFTFAFKRRGKPFFVLSWHKVGNCK